MTHSRRIIASPVGPLTLVASPEALLAVRFGAESSAGDADASPSPWLDVAARQLAEWFAGQRREFELPLEPRGTEFQLRVWGALRRIPFGERRSYRDIAQAIGAPRAVRAVGAANGRNPLSIVIPCHRVVGANGSLTGFSGGLAIKRALLGIEASRVGARPTLRPL
jgi:methylated-DNA-[protein]-cysteine S-methyltransferase